MSNINYNLELLDPNSHILQITLSIKNPKDTQVVSLPLWSPGSYLIRDYAKHILTIDAFVANKQASLEKIDKNSYRVVTKGQNLKIIYKLYAWDISVRGNYFDNTHAFINGASSFLMPHGFLNDSCTLSITKNNNFNFKVACGLEAKAIDSDNFGEYLAQDYAHLIDCPIEISNYKKLEFSVNNIPHKIIITNPYECDYDRLTKDVAKICEVHHKLFNNKAPFSDYTFLLYLTEKSYGGLEHRNSSALIASRFDLNNFDSTTVNDNYQQLLALFSHEYFHSWNIKSLKPKVFIPYDLNNITYTDTLWWFEGVTSYYDDLALLRAKIIPIDKYLTTISKNITSYELSPGKNQQNLLDSSFYAWTKFYQADENVVNSIVSYYSKGSLLAFILDIAIRKTKKNKSLDDVVCLLWEKYGITDKGIDNEIILQAIAEVSDNSVSELAHNLLNAVGSLPYEILNYIGIYLSNENQDVKTIRDFFASKNIYPQFGFKLSFGNTVTVTNVFASSPVANAGIAASDELIAINGIKLTASNFVTVVESFNKAKSFVIHGFRDGKLLEFKVIPDYNGDNFYNLSLNTNASLDTESNFKAWLN